MEYVTAWMLNTVALLVSDPSVTVPLLIVVVGWLRATSRLIDTLYPE